jgi:hypothetical protein
VEIKSEVFFLANASLFKYAFSDWLLNQLYCIPIEREKDTGGRPLNNVESFERSTRHLAKGGSLYIAPEGYSYVYRRLQKIRTGTARIALAAESRHHFQLGLTILPVGLNYSDPTQFRSHLLTIFGEPIRVADFQQDWEKDEVEAVKNLTGRIRERLQGLSLDTADDDVDMLLNHLEEVLQNEQTLPPYAHFMRSHALLNKLHGWRTKHSPEFWKYQQQVFGYFEKLKHQGLQDEAVFQFRETSRTIPLIPMIFSFPVFLLGYLTHFFPAFFTKKLSDWLNDDIHWKATYKYVIGLVFYPLFIGLEIWLASKLATATATEPWLTWLFVLGIVPAGLLAAWWLKKWQQFMEDRRLKRLKKNNPADLADLMEKRASILRQCSDL